MIIRTAGRVGTISPMIRPIRTARTPGEPIAYAFEKAMVTVYAVEGLSPMLQDNDPAMASAAALALGRIGGPGATESLKAALAEGPGGTFKDAVLDGLLRCAESLHDKDEEAAHSLYAAILPESAHDHIRTAAYRGMILTY